jgi:CMP-N-acetylneuraminic acid synthetase
MPCDRKHLDFFSAGFFINGAIYIVSIDWFRKKGVLYDQNAYLYKMDREFSIDIDYPEDVVYENALLEYSKLKR